MESISLLLSRLSNFYFFYGGIDMSRPAKLTALSFSGLGLIGVLAIVFKSRRRRTRMIQQKLEAKKQLQCQQKKCPSRFNLATSTKVVRNVASSPCKRLKSPPVYYRNRTIDVDSKLPGLLRQRGSPASLNSLGVVSNTSASSTITLLSPLPCVGICRRSQLIQNKRDPQKQRTSGGKRLSNSFKPFLTTLHASGDTRDNPQRQESPSVMNSPGAATPNTSSFSRTNNSDLNTMRMSSVNLCHLGMEIYLRAIGFWETAAIQLFQTDDSCSGSVLPISEDQEIIKLKHTLSTLLELGYHVQEIYEAQYDQDVADVELEPVLSASKLQNSNSDVGNSDEDSFVSATDVATLTDLDDLSVDMPPHAQLYDAGMRAIKYDNVPCRNIRPTFVHCFSDVEFLAKLHGIRLAFNVIFQDQENKVWFRKLGRRLIGGLLVEANKNVEDAYIAYDKMMDYTSVEENWSEIANELQGRGVRCMSFYDIVIDFILLEGLDDLVSPPSKVTTIVQDELIASVAKETALADAVRSTLEAKRSLLKHNNGFMSRLYNVSDHVCPVIAWACLGPDSELKQTCNVLKNLVLEFIKEIFSFHDVRFTAVEALAEDILRLARSKSTLALERLKSGNQDGSDPNTCIQMQF